MDKDWIELINSAKEQGATPDEVKEILANLKEEANDGN